MHCVDCGNKTKGTGLRCWTCAAHDRVDPADVRFWNSIAIDNESGCWEMAA